MSEVVDFKNIFSLRNRVALVSGASRGIGLAICEGFADVGATVFGLGRSARPEGSSRISYFSCDVRDDERFKEICDQIVARQARLDIYVHAAGISLPFAEDDRSIASFNETIEVNLAAAYRCCRSVIELMKANRCGSIINVTSIGSMVGFPENPGYVASKGGLRALTKALAVDAGNKNVRVNNLAPGYIRTEMTNRSYSDPEQRAARTRRTILQRWGTPEDLVGAAIFLASDASAYVTGQDIFIDGGWTAKGL